MLMCQLFGLYVGCDANVFHCTYINLIFIILGVPIYNKVRENIESNKIWKDIL